ncbi:MAG: PLDc N-terminal domain-containing protein [Bacteroidota bacterium]
MLRNLLFIVGVVCAIWVIYDVWVKQKMDTGVKIVWTIFALFFNILSAIVYYLVKKR